jgi:chaperonin GroES
LLPLAAVPSQAISLFSGQTRLPKKSLDIVDLFASRNIAELLDEGQLKEIGRTVVEDYEEDKRSKAEFDATIDKSMEIAKQIASKKSAPFENSANVKYPLIATAAIQSAARSYPEVVRNNKVVEAAVMGADPTGEKAARASRVSDHMSAQLLIEDPEWETDTDRLLHCYSILGTVFKKTYWDELLKRNRSIMCSPKDIVVNQNIKSLETARHVTHVIPMYLNDIVSRIRFGIFLDVEDDLRKLLGGNRDDYCGGDEELKENGDQNKVLEQHRYLDLDKDGYEEPYIVTTHLETEKVLRIYRCFDGQNIYKNSAGKIWQIEQTQYFTDFHYIPSPDGSFYSIGFGQLLLPLNETINTTINQLLDAGSISNQQSGFLGRGFKSKSGSLYVAPGEWKKLDISGEDIAKNVYPLPVREPSATLFQLLGLMIQTGKELSSVSDILQGQQPAQNVPATTALALIEQGLKVFSGVQKRLYVSLKKEFLKLYRLNGIYLNDTYEYKRVLQTLIISKEDYADNSLDVSPVSDPSMSSDAQRLARAQALLNVIPMVPPQGGQEIIRNWLDALQVPANQISRILPPPNAEGQPSPQDQQAMMAQQEAKMTQAEMMMQQQLKAEELQIKEAQSQSQIALNEQLARESQARIQKMAADSVIAQEALALDNQQKHVDLSIKAVKKMDDLAEEHQAPLQRPSVTQR